MIRSLFGYNIDMKDIHYQSIEYSINPFFLFDNEGELIDYNQEAEFLLSFVPKEQIYQLALENAAYFRGFKHTFIDLNFPQASFCAISVGYADDEKIAITLHKNICRQTFTITDQLQKADIFTLLDIAINSNMVEESRLRLEYDISIPEFKIDIDHFLKLLNKIFRSIKKSPTIFIKVVFSAGRYIKIESKKYPVVAVDIEPEGIKPQELHTLIKDEKEFLVSATPKGVHIELPFIL